MPLPARPLPPTVQEALQRGNKIEAIKLLRKIEGIGLKEAKDAVEASEAGFPTLSGGRGPGEVPPASNRLWLAALAVAVLLLLYFLLRRT